MEWQDIYCLGTIPIICRPQKSPTVEAAGLFEWLDVFTLSTWTSDDPWSERPNSKLRPCRKAGRSWHKHGNLTLLDRPCRRPSKR